MDTITQLSKAATTLVNKARRGRTINNARSLKVIDRYEDLRDQAIKEGVWEQYCAQRGYSLEHTAYDFFA